MTADNPQPVTTDITRLRSIRRTTARRNVVANKRNNELTEHIVIAPTIRC
jgi:hypothetical protein